jgi:hypothetical protein
MQLLFMKNYEVADIDTDVAVALTSAALPPRQPRASIVDWGRCALAAD